VIWSREKRENERGKKKDRKKHIISKEEVKDAHTQPNTYVNKPSTNSPTTPV
jgi:hypothetical protein